jgi:hypothetical protein
LTEVSPVVRASLCSVVPTALPRLALRRVAQGPDPPSGHLHFVVTCGPAGLTPLSCVTGVR